MADCDINTESKEATMAGSQHPTTPPLSMARVKSTENKDFPAGLRKEDAHNQTSPSSIEQKLICHSAGVAPSPGMASSGL